VTAFFGVSPSYYPDGTPVPGRIDLTYRWAGLSCPSTMNLGGDQHSAVPVDEGGHITSPVLPSRAVSATLTLPRSCQRIGVRFFQPPRQSGYAGAMGVWLTRTPPADLPIFDAALAAKPEGVLRYFFTNCPRARAFRASLFQAVRDRSGLVRIHTKDDIVPDLIGVVARKSGKPDLQAWGLSEGAGVVWDRAGVQSEDGDTGKL
jgi:hypothetical protein